MKSKYSNKKITITLPLDIAQTVQGFVDGCVGLAEDMEFVEQMNIVLNKLEKSINRSYV